MSQRGKRGSQHHHQSHHPPPPQQQRKDVEPQPPPTKRRKGRPPNGATTATIASAAVPGSAAGPVTGIASSGRVPLLPLNNSKHEGDPEAERETGGGGGGIAAGAASNSKSKSTKLAKSTSKSKSQGASTSSSWQARSVADIKMSSIYNRSSTEAPAELYRYELFLPTDCKASLIQISHSISLAARISLAQ